MKKNKLKIIVSVKNREGRTLRHDRSSKLKRIYEDKGKKLLHTPRTVVLL